MSPTAPQLFKALARPEQWRNFGPVRPDFIDWLIDTGFGPLMLKGLGESISTLPREQQQKLQAVNLSARFESSSRTDALLEILHQAGDEHGIGILKGMLFAHNYYDEPHFRPMGDIDLLTAPENVATVVEVLHDIGYINVTEKDSSYYETHHHLAPFYLEEKNVWVELHTGLFPTRSGLTGPGPFDVEKLPGRIKPTNFCGIPVLALNNEMQLFHTSVHWAEEFRRIGGMLGLLDLYLFLEQRLDKLNWDWIFSQSTNPAHIAPAQLAISYLTKCDLINPPSDVQSSLKKYGQLCPTALRIQHAILDKFVVLGEQPGLFVTDAKLLNTWKTVLHYGNSVLGVARIPWNILFPEDYPERYKLKFQLDRLKGFRARV